MSYVHAANLCKNTIFRPFFFFLGKVEAKFAFNL